jgi:hypothetical protein
LYAKSAVGEPIDKLYVDYFVRTVQVSGTFGPGGGVVWEGSNSEHYYFTLEDPHGKPMKVVLPGAMQTFMRSINARPRLICFDGTTNITVSVLACMSREVAPRLMESVTGAGTTPSRPALPFSFPEN